MNTARKMAMVGLDQSNGGDVPHKCEGCGRTVYVVEDLRKQALALAAKQGSQAVIVCYECAEPFFAEVARGEGCAAGPADSMLNHGIPAIEKTKERLRKSS